MPYRSSLGRYWYAPRTILVCSASVYRFSWQNTSTLNRPCPAFKRKYTFMPRGVLLILHTSLVMHCIQCTTRPPASHCIEWNALLGIRALSAIHLSAFMCIFFTRSPFLQQYLITSLLLASAAAMAKMNNGRKNYQAVLATSK